MSWGIWIVAGIVMLVAEALTPGMFVAFFFGLGAILVGLCSLAGLMPSSSVEWGAFPIFSVILITFFRKPLVRMLRRGEPAQSPDSLVSRVGRSLEPIAVDQQGRVELFGSSWTARNVGSVALASGDECRVVEVEGVILKVKKV